MADRIYVANEATSQEILAEVKGLRAELEEKPKRYGFRVNMADGAPASRVTYLYDAVGMTPAKMNTTYGLFDYGDWGDVWFVKKNRPVMVKYDGTVDYELDHSNHTKKLDGTSSDIANTAYAGNAMAEIPLIWVKRTQNNNYREVVFCETQFDESYKALAHSDADGNLCQLFLPMYEGAVISGKTRSLSGQTVTASLTDDQENTAALANGELWDKVDFSSWQLVRDMLTLISRSTNSQASFGNGCSNHTAFLATGTGNGLGQFFGYSSTTQVVKVFFIENWWGNYWNRIRGLLLVNGVYYVKTARPYNNTGANFINTGLRVTGTSGGYISQMHNIDDIGSLPSVVSGSETTFECDGMWFNNEIIAVAFVGGARSAAAICGAACLDLNSAASYAATNVASSVSCKIPLGA